MAYGPSEFASELKALGIDVPRGTLDRLEPYAALLQKWQAKINLVGPATLPDLWHRHFLDSAQLLPLLHQPLPPPADECRSAPTGWGKDGMGGDAAPQPGDQSSGDERALRRGTGEGDSAERAGGVLVDLGSGAGFPGLVLAIMTGWRVHLIDSDQRKCAFLRQVALDCGVLDRVAIHAKRIEQVTGIAADVVTARACAPLDELLGLAVPFVGEGGACLLLKGAQVEEELTQARRRWTMGVESRGSISDPGGKILIITQLKRKSQ